MDSLQKNQVQHYKCALNQMLLRLERSDQYSKDYEMPSVWECLTACKALSHANAKGKGINSEGWDFRML